MEASAILQPVIALGLWTTVMMIWMYATRIPAIGKADIPDDQMGHPPGMNLLPSEVRRIADNYNHLFEQPTLFYAVCLAIAVASHVDAMAVNCAGPLSACAWCTRWCSRRSTSCSCASASSCSAGWR